MKENGNIMKESSLVNEFFQKLTERNGKSIAANSDYSSKEIMLKLARKHNVVVKVKGDGDSPARDHFWVYEINDQLYGLGFTEYRLRKGEKPEYDKTDWLKLEYVGYRNAGSVSGDHPAGPDEWGSAQVYRILGKVTANDVDENVWNFLQDFGWYKESEESKNYQAKNDSFYKDRNIAEEEYKKAKSIINVEILESKFPQPEDFANEIDDIYDDSSWSISTFDEDIDTEFKIKLSIGHTFLYTGNVYPNLSYNLEGSYIEYEGIEEINSIWDDNDIKEIPLVELANKLPEGRFRDLCIKYVSKAVTEAIDAYIRKNSSDYKLDW